MTDLYSASHSGAKPQSLFKLPALFIVNMAVFLVMIFLVGIIIRNNSIPHDGKSLYISANYIYNLIFNTLPFFFLIAVIMFIDQKMHQINYKNILVILAICISFNMIIFLIEYSYSSLFESFSRQPDFYYNRWYRFISKAMSFSSFILSPVILIGLFKIIGGIYQREKTCYRLPLTTNCNLFAFLFSVLFSIPAIIIVELILSSETVRLLLDDFISYSYAKSLSNLYVTIISSVIVILPGCILLINLMLVFFTTRGCFLRRMDSIPLNLLLKSTGLSYLYLIMFNLALILIILLINVMFLTAIPDSNEIQTAMGILIFINVSAYTLGLVCNIKLIRKAVRKYFSEQ